MIGTTVEKIAWKYMTYCDTPHVFINCSMIKFHIVIHDVLFFWLQVLAAIDVLQPQQIDYFQEMYPLFG